MNNAASYPIYCPIGRLLIGFLLGSRRLPGTEAEMGRQYTLDLSLVIYHYYFFIIIL